MISLLSVFIVYDTQIIIGGKHKAKRLSLNDYCIAAIIIYTDVLSLFLQILGLCGAKE
jgi:FtsH-binding integral membrane protein